MRLMDSGTYNPFYQFYFNLVLRVIYGIPLRQKDEFSEFIRNISDTDYAYAPESGRYAKPSITSPIQSVSAYRSLVAARMDISTNLTSFDENAYALHVDVSKRSVDELIADFRAVRDSSIYLFKYLDDEHASFQAKNGNHVFTANGGFCFMIGHVIHHENVIGVDTWSDDLAIKLFILGINALL
ncbi:MAG: hypothetical protein LC101_10790 [Flavobacteriales bacterium]|nr:hypothetical protein [Flavobacteriales bacterium]